MGNTCLKTVEIPVQQENLLPPTLPPSSKPRKISLALPIGESLSRLSMPQDPKTVQFEDDEEDINNEAEDDFRPRKSSLASFFKDAGRFVEDEGEDEGEGVEESSRVNEDGPDLDFGSTKGETVSAAGTEDETVYSDAIDLDMTSNNHPTSFFSANYDPPALV